MSRSTRREKTQAQLRTLESQFADDLVSALQQCAAGKWGIFGQNDHLAAEMPLLKSVYTQTAAMLVEQGNEIAKLRQQLGFVEPFAVFERYLQYRQMHCANSLGEPKLAVQFLRELRKEPV